MPFQKGNQCAKSRLTKKNLLPVIREKVLRSLNRRISELDTVDVKELLAFARTIMPKDVSLSLNVPTQYISHTPRPRQCIESDSTMLTHSVSNDDVIISDTDGEEQ